jgi:hypothetical protein
LLFCPPFIGVANPKQYDTDPDPFHFDADLDSNFHTDADVDPDPVRYRSDANLHPLVDSKEWPTLSTLQISFDLCIPDKELAKTHSQSSFIYFQSQLD